MLKLAFATLGVVFGDIGTSPLYALREALSHLTGGHPVEPTEVLAVVSLLLWSLIIIVTLKYVALLLRADNKGEGGLLSLVVLASSAIATRKHAVLMVGLVGAAFFFGDAMLTPAISVLSAVEGLTVLDPRFGLFTVPAALVVIIALFMVQPRGTAGVASIFAPVTAVWFVVLAAIGLYNIWLNPQVLLAFNPLLGANMLLESPALSLVVLGGVFLAVTGAETLYADMGHFGRGPIRLSWLSIVLPALSLNYLGQGALILGNPATLENPFFLLVAEWAIIPLVILATAVTVIASQAVITGAFSVTQQAIQLGLLPRMLISHTSATAAGQIYISQINWLLLAGVILLVVIFRSSSALASAYGIAVNVSMLIDTALAFVFFWKGRNWPLWLTIAVLGGFGAVETAFLAANGLKIMSGGYVPIIIATVLIIIMRTWLKGRQALMRKLRRESVELQGLLESLERRPPLRVPGTAVFLVTDPVFAPSALTHNLKHNRVLHETLIFLHIKTVDVPRVAAEDRVQLSKLALDAWLVEARAGYMEVPDVPSILRACRGKGLEVDPMQASYFLGRRAIRTDERSVLPRWQQPLFIMLANQSARAVGFFRIPPNRVVELGMQMSV